MNISIKNILKTLCKLDKPPGRLQQLNNTNLGKKIFIDYAHTPEALKKVLISKTINKKKPNILFGCGGERDKEKRSKMGAYANKFADKVYVTDDNPRNENPKLIRRSILSNCKKGFEIPNRATAIKIAINDLKKNDILIIAGKGHEQVQVKKNLIKKFDYKKIDEKILYKKIKL